MHRNNDKKSNWLHLGAGAFHRAHQSWYLNQLHQQGDNSWTLSLANIRNSSTQKTLQQLAKQQGRYTLEIISPEGEIAYQPIEAVENVILWDKGLQSLVAVGASAETKIISFTVTEGGYFLDDNGELDLTHPAIQADLAGQQETSTLYGALVKILRERMRNQTGPVTLLNCDNLRDNGDSVARGLSQFVKAKDYPELLAWIEQNTSAPNGMVDRITPKFDAALFDRLAEQGIKDDGAPLSCEAFSQWVLEDKFIAGRPALENAGVEFVSSVTPYEEAKIRVLNASHSGIAWAGALLGKKYIDQSLQPQIKQWMCDYVLQDVAAALQPCDIDLAHYGETTLNRFSNKWVRDTTQRVSSDSIAKLQQFIVPTLKARYKQGATPAATLILPALWFRFMQQHHAGALPFDYEDRALDEVPFTAIYRADNPLQAFTQQKKLFGSLAGRPELYRDLAAAVDNVDKGLHKMRESA
ncbi:D-arabinitol 4-dehydrogenase [Erwinia pyrifoliae]|uniref:Mannitol dehydrogenase family protein n=1 Tax=Erwinia pyrifoliae TaxID=79967 RepID=A0ABY5X861_ERWPY|nr:D-arabinitol 4-dehydrogenase [Erwinia pyrifoliae]AUX71095.1 mannitol dehydrogenase family protein [Erwinia pyrifoliae]MCA8875194.1 mannitol dehydrogenase family protein [Erwinia pyrifoliae]MCT2385486.1 mannitol dehydrogenase family protein [Erwinia pyrifoliae]MCU8588941.1 mannitol dehydrogenase family protein [Erwinia pyrifoliae]UWS29285.1 mannitol dehydrogenase family protein [Erwinia pyrifoliae]